MYRHTCLLAYNHAYTAASFDGRRFTLPKSTKNFLYQHNWLGKITRFFCQMHFKELTTKIYSSVLYSVFIIMFIRTYVSFMKFANTQAYIYVCTYICVYMHI